MRRIFCLQVAFIASLLTAFADGVHFTYDASQYEQQTVVYAAFVDNNGTRLSDTYNTYYLGAFINGECRYEAQQEVSPSGECYFRLIVGGNDTEIGKRITFKVYKTFIDATGAPSDDNGTEYWLDESQYTTFNGDDRTSDVSNPLQLIFMPVPGVMLPPSIDVYKGQSVDLTSYIYKESYETLPQITWDSSEQGGEFYSLDGNILTAIAKTPTAGAPLVCRWGNEYTYVYVNINVLATAASFIDKYRNGITVPVGDTDLISEALEEGVVLTPADASTSFSWRSSDEEIVGMSATSWGWNAYKVGTATITGYANDESGLTLSLPVTVVQPVTRIILSQYYINAEVGTDITETLNSIVSIYPDNATNKKYTWTIDEGNTSITWSNGKFTASSVTQVGDINSLTVTAQDGYGASSQVYVTVLPTTPKSLSAKQATIYLTNDPSNPNADCTEQILGNIAITPDGLNIFDYTPEFESDDEEIIAVNYDDDDNVSFSIAGNGETTMYVSIFVDDYANMDATGTPDQIELSTSFKIVVKNGLSGFACERVEMTKDETYTFSITPQPEGSDYDASKISIEISPSSRVSFPDSWTFVQSTLVPGSKGLKYELDAKSVGSGNIDIRYDGKYMGGCSIDVGQRLKLHDGWQWIALYEGYVSSIDEMEDIFGDNFSDLRSQDAILINDASLGYFGDLNNLESFQTYKLKLNDLDDDVIEHDLFGNTYLYIADISSGRNVSTRKGWNWIGNPYQYYQKLTDVLTSSTFTKNDWVKTKTASATYNGTTWTGSLTQLTPGEGLLLYRQKEGSINFASEFTLTQNHSSEASPRKVKYGPQPWTFDHSRFEDNMAMVAKVCNVEVPGEVTVWAFVGDECRGCGESVGDLQFIMVNGVAGEKVKFRLYDNMTGTFHDVLGTFTLSAIAGSIDSPVPLFEGQVTSIDDIQCQSVGQDANTYDISGRKVSTPQKGIYIKDGKKIVIK